jgi:hypothetical protein
MVGESGVPGFSNSTFSPASPKAWRSFPGAIHL